MKSLEKLQLVISALKSESEKTNGSFDSCIDLIHEFIVDNEPNKKTASILDFCSKDKTRPGLTGIYHDSENGYAVASDGHVLLASKTEFKEEFGGKVVDKYGNEIEARYPKYNSVLPHDTEDFTTYDISADDLRNGLKSLKAFAKQNGMKKPRFVVKHIDSQVGYTLERLIKFSDFSDGKIQILDGSRPAISYTEDAKVLIMPTRFDDSIYYFKKEINGYIFYVV